MNNLGDNSDQTAVPSVKKYIKACIYYVNKFPMRQEYICKTFENFSNNEIDGCKTSQMCCGTRSLRAVDKSKNTLHDSHLCQK